LYYKYEREDQIKMISKLDLEKNVVFLWDSIACFQMAKSALVPARDLGRFTVDVNNLNYIGA